MNEALTYMRSLVSVSCKKTGWLVASIITGAFILSAYNVSMWLLCRSISPDFSQFAQTGSDVPRTWGFVAAAGLRVGKDIGIACSFMLGLICLFKYPHFEMFARFRKMIKWLLIISLVSAIGYTSFCVYDFNAHGRHSAHLLSIMGAPSTMMSLVASAICMGSTLGLLIGTAIIFTGPLILFAEKLAYRGNPSAMRPSALIELFYPFEIKKVLVWSTFMIGFFWAMFVSKDGLLLFSYKHGLWSVTWLLAAAHLCGFFSVVWGKGGAPEWLKFYTDARTDVYGMLAGAALGMGWFNSLPTAYEWKKSIDVAMLGLPLLTPAIVTLHDCATLKVAGRALSFKIRFFLIAFYLGAYFFCYSVLRDIQITDMPLHEALWYQITILCTGISMYFGAKQLNFYLKEEWAGTPPIFDELFLGKSFSPGILAQVAAAAKAWNDHVRKEKARIRAEKKRVSKKRKKK